MTVADELRKVWECSECRVSSRKPRVGATPLPAGWSNDGAPKCLACRRADGETKTPQQRRMSASVAAKSKAREERHAAIRDALADLAPAQGRAPLEEVAAATETSRSTVDQVRRDMRAAGELPPGVRGNTARRSQDEGPSNADRAKAALMANPGRLDAEIAAEIVAAPKVVARARKKLGLPSSLEAKAKRTRAAVAAALADRTTGATVQEIADAIDRSYPTARHILDHLVTEGRATVLQRGRGQGALYTPTGD